jgi:hypothetical protein
MSEPRSSPEVYQEITVRYGDLWARVSVNGVKLGFGGGELADFPDLSTFEQFYGMLKRAWDFLHPPQQSVPRPIEQPKSQPAPAPRPEERKA